MDVTLRSSILLDIERGLGFRSNQFQTEEGGYLAGRFDGKRVEIVNYWHDTKAERTPASIKFREAHLDYVAEQVKEAHDPALYVIGTWHVHPPRYGSQYSSTDVRSLFIEHSAVKAGGLTESRLPQVHLIISWGVDRDYSIFTLNVSLPDLTMEPAKEDFEDIRWINDIVSQSNCSRLLSGLLINGQSDGVPYSGPAIDDACAAGSLRGCFWFFPYECIHPDVERIYLSNFMQRVQTSAQTLLRQRHKSEQTFLYYRVTRGNSGLVYTTTTLRFPAKRCRIESSFVKCNVDERTLVLLTNPDMHNGATAETAVVGSMTVGEIANVITKEHGLTSAPIVSTSRPSHEISKWKSRTIVDDFGEVILPDDVRIEELATGQAGGAVRLYWRSADLHPDTVYRLRTHRLQSLGYDFKTLHEKHILLVGLGLLGSEMAFLLTASGVGIMTVVDNGVVDFTNIYRQRLYERRDVYRRKVDVTAERLQGAGVKVTPYYQSVPTILGDYADYEAEFGRLSKLVAAADLVIGTLDSYSGRVVLQALCLRHKVPFLAVGIDIVDITGRAEAQANLFLSVAGQPSCYACGRRRNAAADVGTCTVAPIEFPLVACASAFRLVMDSLGSTVANACSARIYVDFAIDKHEVVADPDCEICGPNGVASMNEKYLMENMKKWLIGWPN